MVDRHHPGKAPSALLQMLADGSCRSIAQLENELDLTRRQVSDAASCLLRRDYLMRMATGCYQLSDSGLAAAAAGEVIRSGPRGPTNSAREFQNTLRQRAWRSMRIRRRFTINDLISDAATAADRSPTDNLHRYLRALKSCGVIAELPRRSEGVCVTSNGFKRWMLRRDTGPRAPVHRAALDLVHDFNTQEDLPCKCA